MYQENFIAEHDFHSRPICEFDPESSLNPPGLYFASDDMIFPREVKITLEETVTVFLFEMPSKTVEQGTEEGDAVERENARYLFLTSEEGRMRKVATNETQTEELVLKMKSTCTPKIETKSDYAFASTWDMYDSFASVSIQESVAAEDKGDRFKDAVIVMERVLANNVFLAQQEIFKGIYDELPPPAQEAKKDLLHLWSFKLGRDDESAAVTDMCWNEKNDNILAVAYGKYRYTDIKKGTVRIWNVKNPVQPERCYKFLPSVACLEFCPSIAYLLAAGFYNGEIKVLDVRSYDLKIMALIDKNTSTIYKPIWRIRWFHPKGSLENELLTTGEDGRVFRFKFSHNDELEGTKIMTIHKPTTATKIDDRTDTKYNIPIQLHAPCFELRFRPNSGEIYFVGTSEGFVHRCSMNRVDQPDETFAAHDGRVTSIHFSPFNGKIFATSGADWTVKVWSETFNEPLMVLTINRPVEMLSFSPTHPTIVAAIDSDNFYLWDLRNTYDLLLTELPLNTASLTDLKFTADGKKVIVGDIAGAVHVYSLYNILYDFDDKIPCTLENAIQQALSLIHDVSKKNMKIF